MEEKRFCSDLNGASLVATNSEKSCIQMFFWLQLINTAAMSKHSQGKEVGQAIEPLNQVIEGSNPAWLFFVTVQHSWTSSHDFPRKWKLSFWCIKLKKWSFAIKGGLI